MPERIQLRRTKGWRKPEGAIVVARPGRWGNQYVVQQTSCMCWCVITDTGVEVEHLHTPDAARQCAVDLFRTWLEGNEVWAAAARRELAGRDLCCWCPPGSPCHADVLLDIANAPAGAPQSPTEDGDRDR